MRENNNSIFADAYRDFVSNFQSNNYDYNLKQLNDILNVFSKSESQIRAEILQKDRQAKIKEIFG